MPETDVTLYGNIITYYTGGSTSVRKLSLSLGKQLQPFWAKSTKLCYNNKEFKQPQDNINYNTV